MKKISSLFGACAAESFAGVLCVLGCMGIVEIVAFVLRGIIRDAGSFGEAAADSFLPFICALGYLGMFRALVRGSGNSRGSRYIVRRLRVSERTTFLVRAAYCILCFALFILFQAVMIFLLAFFYRHGRYFSGGAEYLFVSLRADGFLYSIIPLKDIWMVLMNAACVVYSGTAAAYMAVLIRDGIGPIISYAVPVAVILLFLMRSLFEPFVLVFVLLTICWLLCLYSALVYSGDKWGWDRS